MSQAIEIDKEIDVGCPHCQKHFDLKVKTKETKPKVEVQQEEIRKEVQKEVTKIEEKKEPEIKTVIPDHIPGFTCKNGNCDIGIHKNPNYTTRPKGKCTNCGQFNKKANGACPWCRGKDTIEEVDEDELDDLGIPKPEVHDHEHE